MVTPRAANYTSARNEPPRVLTLQYIKFSLTYISVNETKKYVFFCPLAARLHVYQEHFVGILWNLGVWSLTPEKWLSLTLISSNFYGAILDTLS